MIKVFLFILSIFTLYLIYIITQLYFSTEEISFSDFYSTIQFLLKTFFYQPWTYPLCLWILTLKGGGSSYTGESSIRGVPSLAGEYLPSIDLLEARLDYSQLPTKMTPEGL